jgi:hypothetical protein
MSLGTALEIISNCHVAGQPTYTPGYQRPTDGKSISAKCVVPVQVNLPFDKKYSTRLIFWGKAADIAAKSCSVGKQFIYVDGTPESYVGTLFNKDGSLRLGADGQPVKTSKKALNVNNFRFGADSPKVITSEIQSGVRPADFHVPGSPGAQRWAQVLEGRRADTFKGGDTFGYARVRQVNMTPAGNSAPYTPYAQNAGMAGAVRNAVNNGNGCLY